MEKYFKKDYTIIEKDQQFNKNNYYHLDSIIDTYSGIYFDMWKNKQILANGCIYQRFGCIIDQGDVVMDVGANIGMFTNRALYDGASKVICFEPLSLAYKCLIENTYKEDKCELYRIGISDKEECQRILTPTNFENIGCSFVGKNNINSFYSEKIYLNTIDNFYKIGLLEKVDFLKIDCEGYEFKVLNGMSNETLFNLGIKKISMEYHEEKLGVEIKNEIINRFTDLGFNYYVLDNGKNKIINFWIGNNIDFYCDVYNLKLLLEYQHFHLKDDELLHNISKYK